MSECTCHKNYTLDTLIPKVGVITDIRQETPDVKTFRVNAPEGGKLFEHMPGQCAMVCAPGVSEGMFSITSSPTNKEYQEFSIKKCGALTDYLHSLQVGDEITVRGPYGNHFPVEDKLKGKNLLFIAGGIGLAPLRSVINYVLDNRADYGTVDILYGSRSADDLVQLKEIQEVWMKAEGVNVYLTIDREQEGWDGHVGFVPSYLKEIGFDTNKTALVCGPPIMIKFVLAGLEELGFSREQVYTTDDIYALPDGERAELIDGQIYMMGTPSRIHQKLVGQLSRIIGNYIESNHGSCEIYPAPFAVFIKKDDKNYVEPDISVICDKSKLSDRGCEGAPDFIIEIVSPSSRRMDYYKKCTLYAESGVREYWIVDPEKQRTMIYRYEDDAAPMIVPFEQDLAVGIYNDFMINVSKLL